MTHYTSHKPGRGRWHKFVGDIGIYAAGNLGAKVITFLMVPLYTYFIPDTAAFGYFDLCLTATFLLMPLVTLDLPDGIFRYLLDAPDDASRRRVVTATIAVLTRAMAVSLALLLLGSLTVHIRHQWLVLLLLLSVAVCEVYGQLARGMGRNGLFAGMGLASAVLIVVLSVVLVGVYRMGIAGIFIANAAARLLPPLAVECWTRLATSFLSAKAPWRDTARELLHYTLPLLPAVLIWWVLSFGDRWFVLWAAGADANGVYAVAARFTGAIYTFTVIIQQAWQETAILQYNSPDRDRFFSQIFGAFIYFTSLIVILYIALLRLNYGWLVEAHYAASETYLFPMAVAAVIFSTANFLEMGYKCSRETHRTLIPSLATGVLNIVLNLLLAPRWGVWGVIATSLISFTFFAIYRFVDTRRYFTLRPGWRVMVPITAVGLVGAAGYIAMPLWGYALAVLVIIAAVLASVPKVLWTTLQNKWRRNTLFKVD